MSVQSLELTATKQRTFNPRMYNILLNNPCIKYIELNKFY